MPLEKSPVTGPWIDPGTFRLVAQRLNHYATPGPRIGYESFENRQASCFVTRFDISGSETSGIFGKIPSVRVVIQSERTEVFI
jgi:hypothetical protein